MVANIVFYRTLSSFTPSLILRFLFCILATNSWQFSPVVCGLKLEKNSTLYSMKMDILKKDLFGETNIMKSGGVDKWINHIPGAILKEFLEESEGQAEMDQTSPSREMKRLMVQSKPVLDDRCKNCVSFSRQSPTHRSRITETDLWIHQDPTSGIDRKSIVKVHAVEQGSYKKTLLAKSRIKRKVSGWHKIKLKDITKYIAIRDGFLHIDLILQITCVRCTVSMRDKNVPYFELSEEAIIKRELPKTNKCTPTSTTCCLDEFKISFADFVGGLAEIIILPKEINIGICRGGCNTVHTAMDAHSGIIKANQIVKHSEKINLCCVPKKYKTVSTLVYTSEGEIEVRNIHDIVVSECGCA